MTDEDLQLVRYALVIAMTNLRQMLACAIACNAYDAAAKFEQQASMMDALRLDIEQRRVVPDHEKDVLPSKN